jgi:ribonuclease D
LVITQSHQLALLVAELEAAGRFALDTESNSMYVYHDQVCLIQVSTEEQDVIIDPLALQDLSPLGQLVARPDIEVTMHAAENDILLLHRDFGWTFGRIFDTLWGARILGWPNPGLASVLKERFGVVLDKRMQRTDWGKRPLSPEQLAYARLDTHYLLPLRDEIERELRAAGRWEEAQEVFDELRSIRWEERDAPTFWRLPGVRDLEPRQQAVLKALFDWREARASQRDVPPYRILRNEVLLALARAMPQTEAQLRAIPGFPRRFPPHLARKLLNVIRRGQQAPIPAYPRTRGDGRPDDDALARYDALRRWRTDKARERGVAPDVVLPNSKLMIIARANPSSLADLEALGVLGPWRLRAYGREILAVLAQTPAE